MARDITSGWDDMRIYPALLSFIASYREAPDLFQSFAVVFEGPGAISEEAFEASCGSARNRFRTRIPGSANPMMGASPPIPITRISP